MKELLTIKEYAEIKKVSVQSVYQKLNNELKPYLKIINNKKFLKAEILELEKEENKQQEKTTTTKEIEEIISLFKTQIELLNEQLKAKDKQIENLNKHLEEMNLRLQEANQLNHNNQVLLLETKKPNKKGFWGFLKRTDGEEPSK